MRTRRSRDSSASVPSRRDVLEHQAAGLGLLWRAYRHARDVGEASWQFAVLVSTLEALGLNRSDLRELVARGCLAHAVDRTRIGEERRQFRRAPLAFDRRRSFILTAAGADFVVQGLGLREDGPDAATIIPSPSEGDGTPAAGRPRWDWRCRWLWVGRVVVKRFRRAAPNQELILSAFEEQQWPGRIDDPLPGRLGLDARERLHDAIKHLNRNVAPPLIRFHGDGTGCGIVWELRTPRDP